jgi:hypothetical protein
MVGLSVSRLSADITGMPRRHTLRLLFFSLCGCRQLTYWPIGLRAQLCYRARRRPDWPPYAIAIGVGISAALILSIVGFFIGR